MSLIDVRVFDFTQHEEVQDVMIDLATRKQEEWQRRLAPVFDVLTNSVAPRAFHPLGDFALVLILPASVTLDSMWSELGGDGDNDEQRTRPAASYTLQRVVQALDVVEPLLFLLTHEPTDAPSYAASRRYAVLSKDALQTAIGSSGKVLPWTRRLLFVEGGRSSFEPNAPEPSSAYCDRCDTYCGSDFSSELGADYAFPVKCCSRCHVVVFCSQACLSASWKDTEHGHKTVCERIGKHYKEIMTQSTTRAREKLVGRWL